MNGNVVRRISGYATDKLAGLSDYALPRYGNQVLALRAVKFCVWFVADLIAAGAGFR
jgi:hypothetical protein